MAEAKALQSHPAKATEATHHTTAGSDASAALLADAQKFSLELAVLGPPLLPTGDYTINTDVITFPNIVNDKMNAVNNMSASDRQTWLKDFQVASGQSDYNESPGPGQNAPVKLDMQTGTNGKVTGFEITTANYDENRQPSTAVLDGTVGVNGPQNVHFDAAKTQPTFVADEVSGFDSVNRDHNYPDKAGARLEQWAAETQAMPAEYRPAMIKEAQKLYPTVKWNTDAQGTITSLDFGSQSVSPEQWGTSVQADANTQTAYGGKLADKDIAQAKYARAYDSDDNHSYGGGSSGGTGGARSGGGDTTGGQSYIPNGTVVQGVGDNTGLYISNGDGTVSKW